jgi:putative transposase
MKIIFSEVSESFEATLEEFDGEGDHVHLLVHYPPKLALSKLVNTLKGVSSRYLRKEFSEELGRYYWKDVLWSPSYFAGSCGGAPLKTVREYIQAQKTPD